MTTDYPSWLNRAQGNRHALAPIVYFPFNTILDEDYTDGANLLMRFAQWWYHNATEAHLGTGKGKTFRRLPAVAISGMQSLEQLTPMGTYDIFKTILSEAQDRAKMDGSGKPIRKCGDSPDARGYLLFVPGPTAAGYMTGFEYSCGQNTPPPNANPQWPRPGITGLSQKGLEIIAAKKVPYHAKGQTAGYDPVEKTYFYEPHASTWLQWAGAIVHEIGHMLTLPHPDYHPDAYSTIMHAWWAFQNPADIGLLKHEVTQIASNLLLR